MRYLRINMRLEKRLCKICLSETAPCLRPVNYTRTRTINSTAIYRKSEVDGIIKRAKRGELRTRSIKILSARRGLSRPLTTLYLLDIRVSVPS